MTTAFEQLLYVYGDAICGRNTVLPKDCDREAIAQKAIEQNILPLVYFNLYGDETDNKYYSLVMQAVAVNEKRMFFLKKLSEELTAEGIEHCVLKGSSLATLYAMPELRISGDIDILIQGADEKRTMKFLEKRNFVVKERQKGGQNFEATHKMAGFYEFHVQLFDSEFDKRILKNQFKVNQPFDVMTNPDGTTINILGKEDGFYFATSHMIKHFVKDGLGLRQISDWLLYIKKYGEKLDMDRFNSVIAQLGFKKFIDAIYTIGSTYFAMELMPFEKVNPLDILSDMDEGGSFGHNDHDRKKYKQQLIDSLYNKGSGAKKLGFAGRIIRIAFPGKRELVSKGFLKKDSGVFAVPYGWVKRWIWVIKEKKLKRIHMVAGTADVNEEKLEKRKEILRKYSFMKKK